MKITSSADILFALAEGQRIGQLRRALWQVTNKLFQEVTVQAGERLKVAERDGVSKTHSKRRTAWNGVLEATTKIIAICESVAQLQSSEAHAKRMQGEVIDIVSQVIELADAPIPDAILPEELRTQLEIVRAGDPDPERFARSLLGLNWPSNTSAMAESIDWFNWLRLHALNSNLLSEIYAATPNLDAASDSDLHSLGSDAGSQAAALRDAALKAAKKLRDDYASPAMASAMWGAIYEFEEWLISTGTGQLAASAAAATARVNDNKPDANRWAREVGQACEIIRIGLAFDAGMRAILLAYALHDVRRLTAFAETGELPTASATPDLPRSSLDDVAHAAEGNLVEIDAIVSDAEFRVGAPSNRSLLTMGPSGAVRVLVPHVAVDSFGITKGVWVQVRGKAFPSGKDGIAGPVVMAGRVPWAEASRDSFMDALIFAGRNYFEVRPGGLDLVAGRVAGSRTTLNEIGMRE
ncbi:hypothetical protein [Microvirga aerophila]|uniref:Uncharacterized protein n=1 Tax=Microvirga aerophila TaxID=670291 RepID=A0A512C2T9_9HYPH|nr:hypothetical protein [Microvirga aerophila]GEO18534.1 hypothetical protein MAE02_62300 [Microvirga aerophila]